MPPDDDLLSLEDHVFGLPVANRSCGECTACCRLLTIDDPLLQKPAMVLCPNCTGASCAIYQQRPAACRAWHCAWRRIESMPAKSRPDRLGVMFEVTRRDPAPNILAKVYIRGLALASWRDFENPDLLPVLEMLRQTRLPVWLAHDDRMECVHPSRAVQAVLIEGRPPQTPQVAAEAAQWREFCESL